MVLKSLFIKVGFYIIGFKLVAKEKRDNNGLNSMEWYVIIGQIMFW